MADTWIVIKRQVIQYKMGERPKKSLDKKRYMNDHYMHEKGIQHYCQGNIN